MKKLFKEALEDSPIIAAVKDDEGLSRCLTSDSRIIFILYGDIVTISYSNTSYQTHTYQTRQGTGALYNPPAVSD